MHYGGHKEDCATEYTADDGVTVEAYNLLPFPLFVEVGNEHRHAKDDCGDEVSHLAEGNAVDMIDALTLSHKGKAPHESSGDEYDYA